VHWLPYRRLPTITVCPRAVNSCHPAVKPSCGQFAMETTRRWRWTSTDWSQRSRAELAGCRDGWVGSCRSVTASVPSISLVVRRQALTSAPICALFIHSRQRALSQILYELVFIIIIIGSIFRLPRLGPCRYNITRTESKTGKHTAEDKRTQKTNKHNSHGGRYRVIRYPCTRPGSLSGTRVPVG